MSYCTLIKDELATIPVKSPCCRRSLLYGLLYCASLPSTREDKMSVKFHIPAGTEKDYESFLLELFQSQYRMEPAVTHERRGAHKYLNLSFYHKQIFKALASLSEATEANNEDLAELAGFRCPECENHFLRGVFLASGTVIDPVKSYHLEIRSPSDGRADMLCSLFMNIYSLPGSTKRGDDVGFIWKNRDAVTEMLNSMGAASGVIELLRTQLEQDIKNNENRATNWVTHNIERSISANTKQLQAIRYLEEHNLLQDLPDSLRETAEIRLRNPEASLTELAEMHEPSLTKSGLNHRISKILAYYEQIVNQS